MMNKRTFLKSLLGGAGLGLAGTAVAKRRDSAAHADRTDAGKLLLQTSALAGISYYSAEEVWPRLKPGDKLALVRAPWNEYDREAVEVWWQDAMLGHLPRAHNAIAAQMLDRGEPLHAVITALQVSDNPWECITLEVWRDPSVRLPVPAPRRQRVTRGAQRQAEAG